MMIISVFPIEKRNLKAELLLFEVGKKKQIAYFFYLEIQNHFIVCITRKR